MFIFYLWLLIFVRNIANSVTHFFIL
uniref:DUF3265 domain-containing protein n=1 Tax=Heterorhabditis bacteriophora TaxID=37862 RepID=A0A1I7WJ97_HETBA